MAGPQYYGTIPGIAQAFQNDPKNKLAQSALALGTSTAPVAQGGWAATDGLARAAQAVLGAVMQKGQNKKYAEREQAYTAGMAQAAQMANTPQPINPAMANPSMGAAAAALGGQQPPQSAQMAPGGPPMPPAGGMAPMAPPSAVMGASVPAPVGGAVPMPDPISGGTGPKRGAVQPLSFINPLGGTGRPTSSFGARGSEFHNGQDWAAPAGTPIMAAGDGTVIAAGTNARSGNFVRIRHSDGTITGYAHLKDAPDVGKGQAVNAGAVIGSVGSTGHSTGNHLHFTVTDAKGVKINPATIKYGEAAPNAPQSGGTPVTAGIVAPQMEAATALPEMPTQAPTAPARPAEVHTNRIDMAQALMKSGNPDLMAIAQTYMEKGLDEQNAARTLSSQQEQQQNQTGYTAALNDFTGARSDARQNAYTEHRDVNNRNFTREQDFGNKTFQAGQAQVQREYGTSERIGGQQFQASENAANRAFQAQQSANDHAFQSRENQANRDNKLSVANARQQQQATRNAYFSTPTGLKMQQKAGEDIDANNLAIQKYERFMDLNKETGSGGFAQNTLGATGVYNWTDSKKAEMAAIANDTTLAKIGGSLGTAISDGDRKFITQSNVSLGNPRETNSNIARATVAALKRKNDYSISFANAQADGSAGSFLREWSAFANSVPLVPRDAKGNPTGTIRDNPVTFEEWRANRPKYDATGKRVN